MHPGIYAASTPDRPAIVMGSSGQVRTYGEVDAASNRLARLLRARGLTTGDGVLVFMENNPVFLEVVWAAARSGLYYTTASSRLTASELAYIVNDSGAGAVVTSAEKVDVVDEALQQCPLVRAKLLAGAARDGWDQYEEVLQAHPATEMDGMTQGMPLLYSSGTTGRPKGVKWPLSSRPVAEPRAAAASPYGMGEDTVYLSPAPLYHAAPLTFSMGVHRGGGTVVVMEHFDPEQFLLLVERHRVTHTQVVPTMFVRLLKLPAEVRSRYDLSSLRMVVHAAAPCPVPVKHQMFEWLGPIIHEYYGGTEGGAPIGCSPEEWLTHPGTVGRARSGAVHIVHEDGSEAPTGESGTIYFEGAPKFEYLNDPDATTAAYHPEGWTTLGDVGYLDDDGFLYLTDRKAFMIISGGVNIYPQEAENVLVTHPRVLDVAVFGVPNADFGEEVKAVVQLVDPAAANPELEAELIEYCRSQLADLKCPRSIDFRDELPRQPTGKLYKKLLRDEYWAGHDSRLV